MLTSRNGLITNLNYVHLQQGSLGGHLPLCCELSAPLLHPDMGLKDGTGCLHQWKDTSNVLLVDANSNDPSMPCRCCEQNSGHREALSYGCQEPLEGVLCEECQSPDELPLSPLSPGSPSTDSSSSSDFTLDDSPVSMCYREYEQDELRTPDQQPDIIPLDVETEGVAPDLQGPITPSQEAPVAPALEDSIMSSPGDSLAPALAGAEPENVINNMELAGAVLDGNCNTLAVIQKPRLPPAASIKSSQAADPDQSEAPQWPQGEELLPGLLGAADSSHQTPRRTITSFHELAQKRRKSGGHKDKSDWLIIFSPDTEQPPANELTASAFHHGAPLSLPQPEGKGITTFRELRYRNTLSKQSSPQARAQKGPQDSADGARDTAEAQPDPRFPTTDTQNLHDQAHQGCRAPPARAQQTSQKMEPPTPPPRLRSKRGLQRATRVTMPPAVRGGAPEEAGARPQRMADGADHKGAEAPADIFSSVYVAPPPSRLFLQFSTNLTPPPALSPLSSTLEAPCYFVPPPQSWYLKFPVRLSPVGASSPPQRALLPLLDTPDLAILLSPLFPRYRSRNTGPPGAPNASAPDTGEEAEPLMAAGGEAGVLRGKKALLIAIGSAVDRIIAHFNGSRNQVQKAQLGDSRLNPSLGYLIAEGLCPALAALLGDGLKPFQKDVIIGRRKLGPWNLVEASAKTGPEPLPLLFCTITRLQPLRDPQRRFNAFIFSLLNAKQLEAWLSHLHVSYEELSVFFLPSGFLPLAATSLPQLREELLLTLQPLSALTFHTDLLFEHHHLPLQDPPTPQHLPPQSPPLAESWGVPAFQHILDLGGWLAQNLAGETPSQSESCTPATRSTCSRHDGGARGPEDLIPSEPASSATGPPIRDWSRSWWGHLTQASRMYLPSKREPATPLCKLTSRGGPEPHPQGSEEAGITEDPPLTAACLKTNTGSDPTARKHSGPSPQQKAGWFGPLFGESSRHNWEPEGQSAGKSRRPSSWLPPNVSVLQLIRRRPAAERERAIPQPQEETERTPQRKLRALCDHSASGDAQLSFKKDDVLQLLGRLDDDWVHCRHGNSSGLVPVGYTSLIL